MAEQEPKLGPGAKADPKGSEKPDPQAQPSEETEDSEQGST